MTPAPNVIAVDDNSAELATIVTALRMLDVACLPVRIANLKPDLQAPLKGVRLVFFDINYLPAISNEVAMFETAATVLTKVLAKDNGPYVLVTWTSKSDRHAALMSHFAGIVDIPAPALTGFIAKEKFTAAGAGIAGAPALDAAIRSVLASHSQVGAMLDWEAGTRRAAGDVICSLLDLIERKARFAGEGGPELERLLKLMMVRAVGVDNVDGDRRSAINEALAPILLDRLTHLKASAAEEKIWIDAVKLDAGIGAPQTKGYASRLNGLSHVAFPPSGRMEAGDRGVVSLVSDEAMAALAKRAGRTTEELAGDFVTSLADAKAKPALPNMEDVAKRCRWVFLGVRAICDQAQQKGHFRPLVLGLEVPATLKENGVGLRIAKHGALAASPSFNVPCGDGDRAMKLVFNWRWTAALARAELAASTVLYRLREPVTGSLTSEMAGYSARPGIIDYD